MAQSYVISGTAKGASVDATEQVILEADANGNPTKVIGIDQPCELNKSDKATLDSLGIDYEKTDASASGGGTTQVGSDTAGAGPSIG